MNSTTYYFENGKKISQKGLPEGAYVLAGIQDDADRGLVSKAVLTQNGPTLVPVFLENGKRLKMNDNFGMTLRNGEFVND